LAYEVELLNALAAGQLVNIHLNPETDDASSLSNTNVSKHLANDASTACASYSAPPSPLSSARVAYDVGSVRAETVLPPTPPGVTHADAPIHPPVNTNIIASDAIVARTRVIRARRSRRVAMRPRGSWYRDTTLDDASPLVDVDASGDDADETAMARIARRARVVAVRPSIRSSDGYARVRVRNE
jgi:hypothetical protein